MNVNVLEKINSKIETQLKDPLSVGKALDMVLVLKTCFVPEFNLVTKDIQKILKNKAKQYSSVLDNMENLSLGSGKIMIDGIETNLISINRLSEIFKSDPYQYIKVAFCLQPENLILLSLEKEMANEIIK